MPTGSAATPPKGGGGGTAPLGRLGLWSSPRSRPLGAMWLGRGVWSSTSGRPRPTSWSPRSQVRLAAVEAVLGPLSTDPRAARATCGSRARRLLDRDLVRRLADLLRHAGERVSPMRSARPPTPRRPTHCLSWTSMSSRRWWRTGADAAPAAVPDPAWPRWRPDTAPGVWCWCSPALRLSAAAAQHDGDRRMRPCSPPLPARRRGHGAGGRLRGDVLVICRLRTGGPAQRLDAWPRKLHWRRTGLAASGEEAHAERQVVRVQGGRGGVVPAEAGSVSRGVAPHPDVGVVQHRAQRVGPRSGLVAGTSSPVEPSDTVCRRPPTSVATTGRPQAWASSATSPKTRCTRAPRRRRRRSTSGTAPIAASAAGSRPGRERRVCGQRRQRRGPGGLRAAGMPMMISGSRSRRARLGLAAGRGHP